MRSGRRAVENAFVRRVDGQNVRVLQFDVPFSLLHDTCLLAHYEMRARSVLEGMASNRIADGTSQLCQRRRGVAIRDILATVLCGVPWKKLPFEDYSGGYQPEAEELQVNS